MKVQIRRFAKSQTTRSSVADERFRQEKEHPRRHGSRQSSRSSNRRARVRRIHSDSRGLLKTERATELSASLNRKSPWHSEADGVRGLPAVSPENFDTGCLSGHPFPQRPLSEAFPHALHQPRQCRQTARTRRSMRGKRWKWFGTQGRFTRWFKRNLPVTTGDQKLSDHRNSGLQADFRS